MAGLSRPSTIFLGVPEKKQGVDRRDKPGDDDRGD
jgi:hypothetical protein